MLGLPKPFASRLPYCLSVDKNKTPTRSSRTSETELGRLPATTSELPQHATTSSGYDKAIVKTVKGGGPPTTTLTTGIGATYVLGRALRGSKFPRWTALEYERLDPGTAEGKKRGRRDAEASSTVESAEKNMASGGGGNVEGAQQDSGYCSRSSLLLTVPTFFHSRRLCRTRTVMEKAESDLEMRNGSRLEVKSKDPCE